MKSDEAKRLKELEIENSRLKRLLADAELDKAMLKEALRGNGQARRKNVRAFSEFEITYLDLAQLLKHYFGLRRYQLQQNGDKEIVLMYLYCEPTNAEEIAVCREHQKEVANLANAVSESKVRFNSMTYSQLWSEWKRIP